ncbi:GntR family transcriptional regulator [Bradyrhizobium sp. 14AA]
MSRSIAASGSTAAVASPDLIVADIVDGLRTGRYSPGQRLIEPDLMQRYQVSRGSVREALRRLAAERVVDIQMHRGAIIRLLSRDEMIEVLQLIGALGELAMKLAAERVRLGENCDAFKRAYRELMGLKNASDFLAVVQGREAFFGAIVALSGNRELVRTWPAGQMQTTRLQVWDTVIRERLFDDYREIGEGILKGDGARAAKAMSAHINAAIRAIRKLPDQAFAGIGK